MRHSRFPIVPTACVRRFGRDVLALCASVLAVLKSRRHVTTGATDARRTALARVACFTFASCALFWTAPTVHGQSYPSRPIRIIVPYPAGGAADLVARVVAEKLSGTWAPVVVEPKPGANGNIAADYVFRQPGDGYTFLVASGFLTVNPQFHPALKWSHKSFVP
ncbi:partial hypothetical protein, partial [Anaerolineae bacterium]